jgi:hypothetical protein
LVRSGLIVILKKEINVMSKLGKHFRKRRHRLYLEAAVTEMRSRICKQACLVGEVNMVDRHLFIKYNNKLKDFDKKYQK